MSLDPGPQSLSFVPHTGNKKVYVRKVVHHSVGFYFSIFWDVAIYVYIYVYHYAMYVYIYTHIAIPIYTKLYYIRIIIRKEIVILSKKQ